MILRADICDFRFSAGADGRTRIFTLRRSSGRISWSCGLDELKSSGVIVGNTYQGSFARVKGADFELYNIMAMLVGTLKGFSFEHANTERVYQIALSSKTLQCKPFMLSVGEKVIWPVIPGREIIMPDGVNMQSTSGYLAGTGNPGAMKGTRIP
jgi:hypothetical protein